MATTLPSDLRPDVGTIPHREHNDLQGYVCYPKKRGVHFGANLKTELTGAVNIVLTPAQAITKITILAAATFAQITLPGSEALARFIQAIGYLEPETTTEEWWFDLIFENQTALNINLVQGDVSTTFLYTVPNTQVVLGPGFTTVRFRAVTLGTATTFEAFIVPGGTGINASNFVHYAPFPIQDTDEIIVFDDSDNDIPKLATRREFLATNATDNIVLGPSSTPGLTGTGNVFAGLNAGDLADPATANNVGIGLNALRNATGGGSVAIGPAALTAFTGLGGVAIGSSAATTFVTGNITAVGRDALTLATGNLNTACGTSAGNAVTTGTENSFFGNTAGSGVTTGTLNTAVGSLSMNAAGWAALTNSVCLGRNSGAVTQASNAVFFQTGIASVAAGPDAVSATLADGRLHITASSRLLKRNIRDLEIDVNILDQLKPRSFTIGTPEIKNGEKIFIDVVENDIGLIADEVFEIEPRLASVGPIFAYNHDTKKSELLGEDVPRNYYDRRLTTLLLKGIQDLRKRVAELEDA